MCERLMIIGASGHGKVAADIAIRTGAYKEICFLDDDAEIKEVMDIPVVGSSKDFAKFKENSDFFVAIGNSIIRKKLLERLWDSGMNVPVLIHPQAIVGSRVSLGSGTIIMAGAVVNPETCIGKGCIINTCASVDHDCMLEDYVHISVGAHLAGAVSVGEHTWVGAGAIVKNNIDICSNCMIGAGAVVVKKITEAGTYIGIPAARVNKQSLPGG